MRALRTIAIGLFLAMTPALMSAQMDESGLKSAFIYNFVQFVEWPAAADPLVDELRLCTLGASDVGDRLKAFDGALVDHRRLAVRRVAAEDDLGECRVLFIPTSESERTREVLRRYSRADLLSIAERSDLSVSEAVIDLVVVDKRVTFDIDLDAARRQHLEVSSKLVKLARHVHGAAKGSRD